ncbi:MAG: sugar phosphorylase [Proteobacteria bacterium]|nr:sugar phosphorylase [Pseudomonadota bacterium]
MKQLKMLLTGIYGENQGQKAFTKIQSLIKSFPSEKIKKDMFFSEKDTVLITYGDSLLHSGEKPLKTLHRFLDKYLNGVFSTIHILPFYPFSSDDGFSVIDFYSVNPDLGSWEDIDAISKDFKLMFDYVLNHISSKSGWFQNYLHEEKYFDRLAIEAEPSADLSMVTRPRTLPLLTAYQKNNGKTVHVWTTFSADQIDLNFRSIDMMEKMIEVMLFYVRKGVAILRLDAIAYLFKKPGTSCIHLNETHDMVKVFRKVLDYTSPGTIILTETNVPNDENIRYFGNGRNEAQMVYNFTLPPLLLYSFLKEDATLLSRWAESLHLPSETNSFLNFTASHDGIGIRPLEGILESDEILNLADMMKKNGGSVSYKKNPDGTNNPYELNITYLDACQTYGQKKDDFHARRFLAAQAISYVLPGVPATYINSLLGSGNWEDGVKKTGQNRAINREKLSMESVMSDLDSPDSFRSKIFHPYLNMIKKRTNQRAFHPKASFEILSMDARVFAIRRSSDEQTIFALTNMSSQVVSITLPGKSTSRMKDILSGEVFNADDINLAPYRSVWLAEK